MNTKPVSKRPPRTSRPGLAGDGCQLETTSLGLAWSDLVHTAWRTDEMLTTDGVDELKFRGFKVTYELSVDGQ